MRTRMMLFAVAVVGLLVGWDGLARRSPLEPVAAQAPRQALSADAVPGCDPDWTLVNSPNVVPATTTQINAVATVAANDVWAVGQYLSGSIWQTFILHWNGSAWSIVPSPNLNTSNHVLSAVVAVAANDVWAVGYYQTGGRFRTLLLHWNGTAWSAMPGPNVGNNSNYLFGVDAVAANDVWAVGSYNTAGIYVNTLLAHWDGTAWTAGTGPSPGDEASTLLGVTALAANNVWAVGAANDESAPEETLIVHWDGSTWSQVPSPNIGIGSNVLSGVAGAATNDVWAVGQYLSGGGYSTLALHWNGTAWSVVPSPNVGAGSSVFAEVTVVAANDVWAVGDSLDGLNNRTLTAHWDGTAWSVVPGPNVGTGNNRFLGVAAVGSTDLWAAGYASDGTAFQALTAHWDGSAWSIVPSPSAVGTNNYLRGLDALAPNDIWAVGSRGIGAAHRTLTEHWDGSAWSIVPSPSTGVGSQLLAVAAVAPNDLWAVGYYNEAPSRTLIEHWDGSAWSIVPSPNAGNNSSYLSGVVAVSATDVWAVGYYFDNLVSSDKTLILHWNGSTWSVVPSPNSGTNSNYLNAVAAVAGNDVWAVGSFLEVQSFMYRPLTMHWNGSAWSVVASPYAGALDNYLYGVTALAGNDVWAVGHHGSPTAYQTLTLHWNGSAWSVVASPNPGPTTNRLLGVAGIAANDVYAVGRYNNGSADRTLITHWNGSAWSVVPSPNVGTSDNALGAVAVAAPDDVWAVGTSSEGTLIRTLAERYNPCLASPTPGPPPPTATPVSATGTPPPSATRTPGSGTPLPSPSVTPCAIQFSDVDPSNPFYAYIRCLACRGIISGYADGTFRWGADVTRGQLSKIIAGAAGLSNAIPSTQQTFSDVSNANTFWLFVERLAGIGAISGYACGGAGEPCDPQQRPYFRWGANATRGQISKITAVTAGWNGPIPTSRQTFTDVPSTNAFWTWIEELASRQIISGYACGGPGEPCDPANRPYFRWGANATRGQMSKIGASAFFPGCQTPLRR